MNKEQEKLFKENIKEIARLELKNSFNDNLMETLNSAFIFKYVDTLEKQNKKYKEVIDKAINDLDIIIDIVREKPFGDRWIINRLEANKNILKEVE